MKTKLYTLDDPINSSAFRGDGDWNRFYRAERGEDPPAPLPVRHLTGRLLRDFIWTSCLNPIIHDRVVQLLREHEITGWSTYPINVFAQNGTAIPAYHGLAITGRCGPLSFGDLNYRPNAHGEQSAYLRRLRFEPGSWDGSDLFVNGQKGWILATERVKRLFRSEKVTNCRFEPLEAVELLATEDDVREFHETQMRNMSGSSG